MRPHLVAGVVVEVGWEHQVDWAYDLGLGALGGRELRPGSGGGGRLTSLLGLGPGGGRRLGGLGGNEGKAAGSDETKYVEQSAKQGAHTFSKIHIFNTLPRQKCTASNC